jgi:hypothetical protein
MRKTLFLIRLFAIPLALLAIGFLLALAVAAASNTYIESKKWSARDRSITDITATLKTDGGYATYLVVDSYDPLSRTLLAYVRSSALDGYIHQSLKLSPDFDVQRRNAIVKDGIVVGTEPLTDASEFDLRQGTRGIGVLSIAEDGSTQLWYLLIGDPFPRP